MSRFLHEAKTRHSRMVACKGWQPNTGILMKISNDSHPPTAPRFVAKHLLTFRRPRPPKLAFIGLLLAGVFCAHAQSHYTPYTFTTLAGKAGFTGFKDGTNSDARFFFPSGVAVDSAGNVYVGDTKLNAIRKVTADGVVTTLAGGTLGSSSSIRRQWQWTARATFMWRTTATTRSGR